jgi:hypothetical protein
MRAKVRESLAIGADARPGIGNMAEILRTAYRCMSALPPIALGGRVAKPTQSLFIAGPLSGRVM